jgi:hypothetical protein
MLSREDILGADDLQRELVHVPEWNGDVYVRCLTGQERDHIGYWTMDDNGKDLSERYANIRARVLIFSLCDAQGMPLFLLNDVERLGKKSGIVLDRLYDIASRLSGMRKEDAESLLKNSETTTNVASGSDLPSA